MGSLNSAIEAEIPNVHLLISDGHYKAASDQLFAAIERHLTQEASLDQAIAAGEEARCPHREGPYGGYDYGHNTDFYGPEPKAGRYVVRDFRDPASPDWGKWVHQTHDKDEHDRVFRRMTDEHILRSIIGALLAYAPSASDKEPVSLKSM
jgi:hypothetical protein